jgi:cell division protein FtsI/penicillin-binding protein 2
VRSFYISVLLLMFFSAGRTGALQEAVTQAMNGRQGAAVVVDIGSGQILASYRMDVAARRVTQPGSTVKPFTMMALLEERAITEKTAFFCPTVVRIAGRKLDCAHPHDANALDPVHALAHSCNHYFTHAAENLSFESLYRAFSRAGLDAPTGKWDTEIAGSVQMPRTKESLQLMSIGETNVMVTPLALAEAYRRLALRLRDEPEDLKVIRDGMEAVVDFGTGQAAAVKGLRIAGKTGTSGGHAWFAGFAPAERPQVVAVVFLERGTGGRDAAPLAGKIFRAAE